MEQMKTMSGDLVLVIRLENHHLSQKKVEKRIHVFVMDS